MDAPTVPHAPTESDLAADRDARDFADLCASVGTSGPYAVAEVGTFYVVEDATGHRLGIHHDRASAERHAGRLNAKE